MIAWHEFDLAQLRYPVVKEIDSTSDSREHLNLLSHGKRRELCEESFVSNQNKRRRHEFDSSRFGESEVGLLGGQISNMRQYLCKHDNQSANLENKELIISEATAIGGLHSKENESEEEDTNNSSKQNFQLKGKKSGKPKATEQDDTENYKRTYLHPVAFGQRHKDQTPTSIDLHDSYDSFDSDDSENAEKIEDDVDHFASAIPYKRGDKMKTIPPANIW